MALPQIGTYLAQTAAPNALTMARRRPSSISLATMIAAERITPSISKAASIEGTIPAIAR
jgi:hypothetical protein